MQGDSRGSMQFVDVAMTFIVVVGIVLVAPFLYKFIGMVSSAADPFSALLLQIFVPLVIIAVLLSVGVSARRGG